MEIEDSDNLDLLLDLLNSNDEVPSTSNTRNVESDKALTQNDSTKGYFNRKSVDYIDKTIDPLENELRLMEEKMMKLRRELTIKKKLSSDTNEKFIKYSSVVESSSESSRYIEGKEKEILLTQLKRKHSEIHSGDTDSEDDDDNRTPMDQNLNSFGRDIRKRIAHKSDEIHHKNIKMKSSLSKEFSLSGNNVVQKLNDSSLRDPFSGIKICNPLVSGTTMQDLMQARRMITMSSIVSNLQGGEIDGDWVTMGVVVSKSPAKTSQKGSQYCIWQLSDLKDCTKPISLFLFSGAYKSLWKSTVGTVVGLLNPQIMKERQDNKAGSMSLSVNDHNRVLLMGSSKDLGWCKGRTKAGIACSNFVNISVCEFCVYHVQAEYKKSCAKRSDLQSSFSRIDPHDALKNKILGKNTVFYGGQSFSSSVYKKAPTRFSGTKPAKANHRKDLSTLSSLGVKRKVESLKDEARLQTLQEIEFPSDFKHMSKGQILAAKQVAAESKSLGQLLLAPSPGARNFLMHHTKEEEKKMINSDLKPLSAKELLLKETLRKQSGHQKNLLSASPMLGRGLEPSLDIEFDIASPQPQSVNRGPTSAARKKAASILKRKGALRSPERNAQRNRSKAANEDYQKTIKNKLEMKEDSLFEINDELSISVQTEMKGEVSQNKFTLKKSLLGSIDLNSEKMKSLLDARSNHINLIQTAEDEQVEQYYNTLEKKEMLENKMLTIKEVETKAVVCPVCNYTALRASDLCRNERHPIKIIQAKKRFFECQNCKRRKISLDKIPSVSCNNCGHTSWKRVAMGKERKGPQMENEILSLRGDELAHCSATSDKVYLHI